MHAGFTRSPGTVQEWLMIYVLNDDVSILLFTFSLTQHKQHKNIRWEYTWESWWIMMCVCLNISSLDVEMFLYSKHLLCFRHQRIFWSAAGRTRVCVCRHRCCCVRPHIPEIQKQKWCSRIQQTSRSTHGKEFLNILHTSAFHLDMFKDIITLWH